MINTDLLTPGWHLSEHTLVYEADVAMDGSEAGQRRRASSEFMDASSALFKTVNLLKARERKAHPGDLLLT